MSGGLSLVMGGVAAAAPPPAWCKGAAVGSPDLSGLSSKDVPTVIRTFVNAECAPTAEVEGHRAELEKARAAWSRRLGMTEADWADAVAYAATRESSITADVSTKTLAAATPLDQYALIVKANESFSKSDAMYATDMFEGHLSETGRYAFLATTCFDAGRSAASDGSGMLGTEVLWAICQPDFARFDLTKLFGELRADTAHDGALKMKLRVELYDFPARIKEHAAEVQAMLKRDDANQKLFELAAGAREDWAGGIGKNTKLLDLVLRMESADFAQSRKQLEGCEDATAAALAEAVSTIPAKAFAGMQDVRDTPGAGFATAAGPVLAQSPAVTLAAIAYTLCIPESGISGYLKSLLAFAPGARGPRNAALGKIRGATLTYDNVHATLSYPKPKPYGELYREAKFEADSFGGVVVSTKRSGDQLQVEIEKTLVKQMDCLASHSTGKVARVRDNGSVEYERVCDRSGAVVHDQTWMGLAVAAKYADVLKRGVRFSMKDGEVIAVWPSKTAKAPSIVLGGKLN